MSHPQPAGELQNLRYSARDGVALIIVDRPDVHNAINLATIEEFQRVLDTVEADPHLGAMVLTGTGAKSFVSGGDLKDFERITTKEAAATMSRDMQHLGNRLRALPFPVIGAINGDSFGGGCEVALFCDIRIASRTARFGFKQVTIGVTPAWGGRQRLVELVGRSRALYLLLTGELVDAAEALRIGLIEKVVEPEETLSVAMEIAAQIAAQPALAARTIKKMVDEGAGLRGEEAVEFEADLFSTCWVAEDHWEALQARKAGRKPNFRRR